MDGRTIICQCRFAEMELVDGVLGMPRDVPLLFHTYAERVDNPLGSIPHRPEYTSLVMIYWEIVAAILA